MNAKQLNKIFARAMYSMVIVAMVFSTTGIVYAQEESPPLPNPHIEAFAWLDRIQLFDWPSDVTVAISISNPYLGSTGVTVDSQGFAEFYPEVDLQPESIITAEYGDVTKILEISPLSATVDPMTGVVSGVATPNSTFHMRTDGDNFQFPVEQDITTDMDENTWSVTIGDYTPWAWFTRGEMWEGDGDGDVTYAIWHVQQNVVEVWLTQNEIRAFGWPSETDLDFYVNGEYLGTATTQPVDWYEGTWAVLYVWDYGLQLEPGMEVTVTGDGASQKSTIIQDLKITYIDIDNDVVYGYAPPNADLELASWEDSPPIRFFNNGDDPNWTVDYKDPSLNGVTVDLNPDDDVRLFMRDEEKDSTVWQSFARFPHFTVYPEWEAVEAWGWPEGIEITANLNGNPACNAYGTPEYPDWDLSTTNVWMNFPEGCDVVAGNNVILSAVGVPDISHTVQNLSVTEVNAENDTVAGTADEGVTVYVWPHGFGEYEVQPTADGGVWQADFSGFEEDILQPGMDGRSEVRDDYGNSTAVDWHAPNPSFTVFPEQSAVEGWDWPLDSIIHLTIEDLNTNDSPDYQQYEVVTLAPWGSGQLWVWFEFPGAYDMKPGDVVTLTDGVTERTHVVQSLDITEINLDENQVYGTTDGEKNVTLWSWEDPDGRRIETTSDGNWGVDFDDIGFTLELGYHVRAEVWIDGNNTAVDRYITNPRFTVFPEWEWFDGIDWPDGSTVFISVEGKDDCSTEGTSWDYFFNGGFPEGCDIEIGDTVTFTDGETVRTHIVQNLSITKVEPGNDVVKGTADAGAEVHVWPHATGQEQTVTTNPMGKWNVSFLGIYDLMPGDGGRAEIRDEDGNATAVDWYIPRSHIVASITEDWFYLQEFSPNTTLNFTVYTALGGKPIWKGTATTDESGFAWIDAEGRWDLVPGFYLIVKDGSNTKDLVIEGFTFDVFNLTNGQLSGTAPEPYGRNVWVGIGFENDVWDMEVATDEAGAWFADFGQPVLSDYQWVAAQIFDNDGDATELRPSSIINWTLVIANQTDWVDSGIYITAGQIYTVEAFGLMNPCSDTYPNGADYCIFYTPMGADGEVPYENEFDVFPGPGLSFMALLGRIGDDGEPFYVGADGTFTAEQDGTLWFTPNDNLRTDNQGAYSVLVRLEP